MTLQPSEGGRDPQVENHLSRASHLHEQILTMPAVRMWFRRQRFLSSMHKAPDSTLSSTRCAHMHQKSPRSGSLTLCHSELLSLRPVKVIQDPVLKRENKRSKFCSHHSVHAALVRTLTSRCPDILISNMEPVAVLTHVS